LGKDKGIKSKLRSIFRKDEEQVKKGVDKRLQEPEFNINRPETVTPETLADDREETGEHKRVHARHMVRLSVGMSSEHNFYKGFSENISEGGIFVATHDPLPEGERVKIEFTLPSGKEVDAMGEVRWIRDQMVMGDTMPGMGIRFLDLCEEDRVAIENFLKKRDPLFHDDEF